MMFSAQDRIAATVAYADVFDYPLTIEEVHRWIIGTPVSAISTGAHTRIVPIHHAQYLTLVGREHLCAVRHKRHGMAQVKWQRIRKIAEYYRWIPTVMLVGVTGGLAMDNAQKSDDIDLFFITKRGTLWISRLFVLGTTQLLGVRRMPGQRRVADRVCLNMFMSQCALGLDVQERDLFAAHEILQMQQLWDRQGAYREFLAANTWVERYLPNAWDERYQGVRMKYYGKGKYTISCFMRDAVIVLLRFGEPLARIFQLWYMHNRRTREVIEPGVLRFHPRDARIWVRNKFEKRLTRLKLPLDKIFFHR